MLFRKLLLHCTLELVSAQRSVKRYTSVYHSPMDLLGKRLTALQNQKFGGLVFQVEILKMRLLTCGMNPLFLRGKLQVLSSLNCGLQCQGWGLWWNCIPAFSTCSDVSLSFAQCEVVVLPVLRGFFLEETVPCRDLVCPQGEMSSGSFYITTLNWTSSF